MIGLLLSLYPAQWRRRYGEEFRAVLESRPLGPFDVADVLLGALDARSRALRRAGSPETSGGRFTMLRIGGLGAVAGGTLWAAGFIGASVMGDSIPVFLAVLAAGSISILVALVGLSAFQAHSHPRLAWGAFVIPAAGAVVSLLGMYGLATQSSDGPMLLGWSPWGIWILGVLGTAIGSILFGLATFRSQVLSRPAAIALTVSSTFFVLVAMLGIGGAVMNDVSRLAVGAAIVAFGCSWAWLGISALRRGPIRAIAAA